MISNLESLLSVACQAVYSGGLAILSVYDQNLDVELKDDDSPVTIADKKSNEAIIFYLNNGVSKGRRENKSAGYSSLPIISEETPIPDFEIRQHWQRFWMIDPLDGTSEFIKKSVDFGVMIALIENNHPVIGVIFFPLHKTLYFGCKGLGTHLLKNCREVINEKMTLDKLLNHSTKLPLKPLLPNYTLLQSKTHLTKADEDYVEGLRRQKGNVNVIKLGSCLKFAYLAEGRAHEFSRFTKVHEWDVAAGHALVENAGGTLKSHEGITVTYNNREPMIKSFKATLNTE